MKICKQKKELVKVKVGMKCDVCGTESHDIENDAWTEISHHHEDWGNDSCDSYEYFDVCSVDCYIEQLKRSVEELRDYHTGEINDMSCEFVSLLIKRWEEKQ